MQAISLYLGPDEKDELRKMRQAQERQAEAFMLMARAMEKWVKVEERRASVGR